jgi:hypothetical protein
MSGTVQNRIITHQNKRAGEGGGGEDRPPPGESEGETEVEATSSTPLVADLGMCTAFQKTDRPSIGVCVCGREERKKERKRERGGGGDEREKGIPMPSAWRNLRRSRATHEFCLS